MNTLKDYVNFKLTHADKIAEAEGYPLVMENCKANKKMKQLEVYGNSVQDGTPTPEAPIEVQSVGEMSVNLFDKSSNKLDANSFDDSGNVVVNAALAHLENNIPCKPNTEYTLSGGLFGKDMSTRFFFFDVNNKWINRSDGSPYNPSSFTYTTPDNCYYLNIQVSKSYTDINLLQIQEGATATPYEPYGKYKIPVVCRGKNLATAYDVCKDFDYYTEVIEDGKKCVRYLDAITVKANPFGFKENTQYTVSFDCKLEKGQWGNDETTPTSILMVFHYADGTKGNVSTGDGIALNVRGIWTSKTMTSNPSKTVIGIGTCATQYVNYNYIDVDTFQIQEGAIATPYEPYIEPVTTNVFMSEPLGIGEYIDFKNKKVVRDMSSEIIECQLPTLNAKTTIIEVDTSLAPSNIFGKYIKK